MGRYWYFILLLSLGSLSGLPAQDRQYSISVFGSLSTSSKLFYNPNDLDEIIRSQFLPLNNAISGGVDVRRAIDPLGISLGMSIEYLSKSDLFIQSLSPSLDIPVRDGFVVIPVELSAYFPIPVGSDVLRFYMGGGAGAYFGERRYDYAGVPAPTLDRKTGYGIHIVSGLEYFARPSVSLRSELKFRNVQFENTNQFLQSTAVTSTSIIRLDQAPFASRVSIDGVTLSLQFAYHFR